MAIHRGRVCWRDLDGDLHRRDFPFDLNAKAGTDGKSARGKGVDGENGGACRDGYERVRRLIFLAAGESERVYGGQQLLRDGLGLGVGRYPAWAAHCRSVSGVGSPLVLERVFL